MSHHNSRSLGSAYIETAAEMLLKERAAHEQQILRIDAILEQMKALGGAETQGERSSSKKPVKRLALPVAPLQPPASGSIG